MGGGGATGSAATTAEIGSLTVRQILSEAFQGLSHRFRGGSRQNHRIKTGGAGCLSDAGMRGNGALADQAMAQ